MRALKNAIRENIIYSENIGSFPVKNNYITRDDFVLITLSHENRTKMVYESLYARTKGGWLVV